MGKHHDKEWLQEEYNSGTKIKKIAEKCGVTTRTIDDWLDRHDIERDRGKGYRPDTPESYRDEAWLRARYWEDELSTAEIASECDCSKETIRRWMRRHDIDMRDASERVAMQWKDNEQRRQEIGEILAEYRSSIHPSFFMDKEGYNIAAGKSTNGDVQVRMNRLLATLLVDDIKELRDMHAHHKNDVQWLDFEDNIEVLTPEEHGEVTRGMER